jgi:hypothetical protein
VQVTTAANVVVKGVGIIAKANNVTAREVAQNRTAAGHRRALLDTCDAGTCDASSDTAALELFDRLDASSMGLLTLTMGSAVDGRVANGGSASLCASVLRGVLDGQSVESRCDAGDTSRRRLLQSGGNPAVILPSDFSTRCAADSICSTAGGSSVSSSWLADPATVVAVVQNWPATSILGSNIAVAPDTQLTPATGECCCMWAALSILVSLLHQENPATAEGCNTLPLQQHGVYAPLAPLLGSLPSCC